MSNSVRFTGAFCELPLQVFDAWTLPARFAVWFGTAAISADDAEIDVRAGGAWKASMHLLNWSLKQWVGEFTEVHRPTRLTLTLSGESDQPAREPVAVDFVATDISAQMIVVQSAEGFDKSAKAAVAAGYGAFFDDMEKVLSR